MKLSDVVFKEHTVAIFASQSVCWCNIDWDCEDASLSSSCYFNSEYHYFLIILFFLN